MLPEYPTAEIKGGNLLENTVLTQIWNNLKNNKKKSFGRLLSMLKVKFKRVKSLLGCTIFVPFLGSRQLIKIEKKN